MAGTCAPACLCLSSKPGCSTFFSWTTDLYGQDGQGCICTESHYGGESRRNYTVMELWYKAMCVIHLHDSGNIFLGGTMRGFSQPNKQVNTFYSQYERKWLLNALSVFTQSSYFQWLSSGAKLIKKIPCFLVLPWSKLGYIGAVYYVFHCCLLVWCLVVLYMALLCHFTALSVCKANFPHCAIKRWTHID